MTRLTWLGHSTVLLELGGVRLLTDPVLRTRVAHLRRHGPPPSTPEDVDAVLVSHLHYDHLDLPSLRRVDCAHALVPAGAASLLRGAGFERIDELRAGDATAVGAVRIEATYAEHQGERRPGGPKADPLGYVVHGDHSIYFAGDTDLFDGMADLGPVDVALLPVAGWSPKLPAGHLDAGRAARAAALLRPRVAVPIHWGTLHPVTRARGEWFTDPPREFATQVAELAPEVEVRVLSPGESLEL